MNFLHDFTLFVVDIHQIRLILRSLSPNFGTEGLGFEITNFVNKVLNKQGYSGLFKRDKQKSSSTMVKHTNQNSAPIPDLFEIVIDPFHFLVLIPLDDFFRAKYNVV